MTPPVPQTGNLVGYVRETDIYTGAPIAGATVDVDGWRLTAEQGMGRRNRIGSVLAVRVEPDEDVAAPVEDVEASDDE